jgi:acetate kinase
LVVAQRRSKAIVTPASVLTVNAGSSSVKLRLLGDDDEIVESIDAPFDPSSGNVESVVDAIAAMGTADVVAHRVVHGGTRFTDAVEIDADALAGIAELVPLAPLHQPASLRLIRAVSAARPSTPAVACFDTAFHATMPPANSTYAIPERWRVVHGLRRFGFHGLSHDDASRRACAVLGLDLQSARVVTCHLGSGASVCAVHSGVSVDTTMGFTPLDGLVMATRSGSIDPGAVLWLVDNGISPADVQHALEHESGLIGLAGTADMRDVLQRATAGEERSTLARDVYIHRLRSLIAAMAASMDGVDALVFTGGVGENSAEVRCRATHGLTHLGIVIDSSRNDDGTGDRDLSASTARSRVAVVGAREDRTMARLARQVIPRR